MKKDKKTMQNNSAKQNVGINELSEGDLEKTSGGTTSVYEGKDHWYVSTDFGKFEPNKNTELSAKKLGEQIDAAVNAGKFHDMRDKNNGYSYLI